MDWRLLEKEIYRRCNELISLQQPDGTWRFCFENSLITDAYMLILIQTIGFKDEKLVQQLSKRILSQQSDDGLWRAYPDEKDGNLSTTIQAYVALLYSKKIKDNDARLYTAKMYIKNKGGFKNADLLTKVFLAMNGLYEWPSLPIDPAILFSLPLTAPINIYDISSYARAHFAPVFLMTYKKKFLISNHTPEIQEFLSDDNESSNWKELLNFFNVFDFNQRFDSNTNQKNVLSYIMNHLESDGTLLSYSLPTIFMIYGLVSSGYDKNNIVVQNAWNGLLKMFCDTANSKHLQNSPSTIWDTSLILYTLQEAGIPLHHSSLIKGSHFLLKHQQTKFGDWIIHNPDASPGGWGFSVGNTFHPDNDDTQASLRTIANFYSNHSIYQNSYHKGVFWLLSMQNNDGGWAAFEKNTNRYLLGNLPLKNAHDAIIDPSTADITGRTLEFLGRYHGMSIDDSSIKKAVNWLWEQQEENGSWYGRWGVCYVYGTWAAITGLIACGVNPNDRRIQNAKKWLLEIQQSDGGWGESCESDFLRKYVSLNESTPSQTAWTLNALTAINRKPSSEMVNAASWLIMRHKQTGYPTGAGLPGAFYIRYHSYDHIWPLLALTQFYKKYYHVSS